MAKSRLQSALPPFSGLHTKCLRFSRCGPAPSDELGVTWRRCVLWFSDLPELRPLFVDGVFSTSCTEFSVWCSARKLEPRVELRMFCEFSNAGEENINLRFKLRPRRWRYVPPLSMMTGPVYEGLFIRVAEHAVHQGARGRVISFPDVWRQNCSNSRHPSCLLIYFNVH